MFPNLDGLLTELNARLEARELDGEDLILASIHLNELGQLIPDEFEEVLDRLFQLILEAI